MMTIRNGFCHDIENGLLECLSEFWKIELKRERLQQIFREREEMNIRTYVCLLDNKVVGTASLFIEPKFKGRPVGHIEDVATSKHHQGMGVASLLIKYIIGVCRHANCYKVILNCNTTLESFYEKFDFRFAGFEMRLDLP